MENYKVPEIDINESESVVAKRSIEDLVLSDPTLRIVADKYEGLGNSPVALLKIVEAQNTINEMISEDPDLKSTVDEYVSMGNSPTEILTIISEQE